MQDWWYPFGRSWRNHPAAAGWLACCGKGMPYVSESGAVLVGADRSSTGGAKENPGHGMLRSSRLFCRQSQTRAHCHTNSRLSGNHGAVSAKLARTTTRFAARARYRPSCHQWQCIRWGPRVHCGAEHAAPPNPGLPPELGGQRGGAPALTAGSASAYVAGGGRPQQRVYRSRRCHGPALRRGDCPRIGPGGGRWVPRRWSRA